MKINEDIVVIDNVAYFLNKKSKFLFKKINKDTLHNYEKNPYNLYSLSVSQKFVIDNKQDFTFNFKNKKIINNYKINLCRRLKSSNLKIKSSTERSS